MSAISPDCNLSARCIDESDKKRNFSVDKSESMRYHMNEEKILIDFIELLTRETSFSGVILCYGFIRLTILNGTVVFP